MKSPEAKRKKEAYKDRIHANLEKEKKALIERLEAQSEESEAEYQQDYAAAMSEYVTQATTTYSSAELTEMEATYRQAKAEEKDVEGRREDVRESAKSFMDNLGKNFGAAFREHNLSALRKIGMDFSDDVKDIFDNIGELSETKKDAEQASSDALISTVRDMFTARIGEAQQLLEAQSRAYWAAKTEQLKLLLSQIVTNSSALTDEKRTELSASFWNIRNLLLIQGLKLSLIKLRSCIDSLAMLIV